MKKIYTDNGLPFYEYWDIRDRQWLSRYLIDDLKTLLRLENRAWAFFQIEAPSLIPKELVSAEYGEDDLHVTQDYFLRPETTPASYAYAAHLLEHQQAQPPFCVWQLAKSYRRENDQVSANVRLKEFYQQEFQCLFTEGTMNDYQTILPDLATAIEKITGRDTRIVESDRLPSYSEKTLDIEVRTSHKWLEVCSSSTRNDSGLFWKDKPLKNVEFAFGIDRILYAKDSI